MDFKYTLLAQTRWMHIWVWPNKFKHIENLPYHVWQILNALATHQQNTIKRMKIFDLVFAYFCISTSILSTHCMLLLSLVYFSTDLSSSHSNTMSWLLTLLVLIFSFAIRGFVHSSGQYSYAVHRPSSIVRPFFFRFAQKNCVRRMKDNHKFCTVRGRYSNIANVFSVYWMLNVHRSSNARGCFDCCLRQHWQLHRHDQSLTENSVQNYQQQNNTKLWNKHGMHFGPSGKSTSRRGNIQKIILASTGELQAHAA